METYPETYPAGYVQYRVDETLFYHLARERLVRSDKHMTNGSSVFSDSL